MIDLSSDQRILSVDMFSQVRVKCCGSESRLVYLTRLCNSALNHLGLAYLFTLRGQSYTPDLDPSLQPLSKEQNNSF